MFARTERLLLRPGFPEDAPALAAAIGDEKVARNLATVPWPYSAKDAEAFLTGPRDPLLPSFLVTERTEAAPRIVGGCGLSRRAPPERSSWASGSAENIGAAASRPKPQRRSSTSRAL